MHKVSAPVMGDSTPHAPSSGMAWKSWPIRGYRLKVADRSFRVYPRLPWPDVGGKGDGICWR